jgi:indolepyruvate ferredoxin oxidoreductase
VAIACPWPISKSDLQSFADGLELLIVIEEKRSLIEVQVREELYGTTNQPVCIGKRDEQGNWLFPVKGALDPNEIAICIGERILQRLGPNEEIAARVAGLKQAQSILAQTQEIAVRTPYFCSGCPHNSSTVVPEGMRAYAGIGCHYMAQWMDRSTLGYTQMGGRVRTGSASAVQPRPRVPKSRRRDLQPFGYTVICAIARAEHPTRDPG